MKKFAAFLMILSLTAFSIGCDNADQPGGGGGDTPPAGTDTDTDTDAGTEPGTEGATDE